MFLKFTTIVKIYRFSIDAPVDTAGKKHPDQILPMQ
jgi:hypothetical protein